MNEETDELKHKKDGIQATDGKRKKLPKTFHDTFCLHFLHPLESAEKRMEVRTRKGGGEACITFKTNIFHKGPCQSICLTFTFFCFRQSINTFCRRA